MAFLHQWKTNWELQSFTKEELTEIVKTIAIRQLDAESEKFSLSSNIIEDYDADSVDIVAILLELEELFKNASSTKRIVVPTDKLGEIVFLEDIFGIIYDVLVEIEKKMDVFTPIRPKEAETEIEKVTDVYK